MDTWMGSGLVGVAKKTYTASLGEAVVPHLLMMPLVRGELVGLIWVGRTCHIRHYRSSAARSLPIGHRTTATGAPSATAPVGHGMPGKAAGGRR
ncbi:hypothetical protein WDH52_22880 [Streptomyces sp. TRM70308]|uniref:hypothetical protein n=1 Tax=Streptomyces sp. TRM70308 TaxID=3131932 RepID=UPI003D08E052